MRSQYTPFFIYAGGSTNDNNAKGGYLHADGETFVQEDVHVFFYPTERNVSEAKARALKICSCHDQESVLYVDIDRNAFLIFNDGKVQDIGKFTEYKSHNKQHREAIKNGYTMFKGRCFICA